MFPALDLLEDRDEELCNILSKTFDVLKHKPEMSKAKNLYGLSP